jgi:HEAT repeat protein
MLYRERSVEPRTKAAEALGIISATNAVPDLQKALGDQDDNLRTEVVCSLGHLGDTNSLASVIGLLRGHAENVQLVASYFLVEIGGSAGIRALTNNLHDSNPATRLAAACALAMMGQTNGLEVIRDCMNHSETLYRLMSVVALAQHKSPAAAELLRMKTADPAKAIAYAATAALSGTLTEALIEALTDRDEKIRLDAAFMFVFLNDAAAIPALRKACFDRDLQTRHAARWAVRRLERMNRVEQANQVRAAQ